MTVQSDPAVLGQKEILTEWPVEEGLTLGTTRLKLTDFKLKPEVSLVREREKIGL